MVQPEQLMMVAEKVCATDSLIHHEAGIYAGNVRLAGRMDLNIAIISGRIYWSH